MTSTECQCTNPGYCSLMQREMSEVRHYECKNKPHYFKMFLGEAGNARSRPFSSSQVYEQEPLINKSSGPGTELKLLLSRFNLRQFKSCGCNKHIVEMNTRGVDWCSENLETIVGWLRTEATKQGIIFFDLPARVAVKLAIKNAEKKL
jgi:hypothetical protein